MLNVNICIICCIACLDKCSYLRCFSLLASAVCRSCRTYKVEFYACVLFCESVSLIDRVIKVFACLFFTDIVVVNGRVSDINAECLAFSRAFGNFKLVFVFSFDVNVYRCFFMVTFPFINFFGYNTISILYTILRKVARGKTIFL